MINEEFDEQGRRIYGDENTNYSVLARDMTSEDAKIHSKLSFNDGVDVHLPFGRLAAIKLRSEE